MKQIVKAGYDGAVLCFFDPAALPAEFGLGTLLNRCYNRSHIKKLLETVKSEQPDYLLIAHRHFS